MRAIDVRWYLCAAPSVVSLGTVGESLFSLVNPGGAADACPVQPSKASTLDAAIVGRRLLVALGSYRSKRHVYVRARELGARLVVLDGPEHWARGDVGEDGLFDAHVGVDLEPRATFVARAVDAVVASGLELHGIGTIDEFAGPLAARVAAALRLPFHGEHTADVARDKHRVREVCAVAGIPGPRHARVRHPDDVAEAVAHVGLPAILKPVAGVGSVDAFRVDSLDSARERAHDVLARATRARADDAEGRGSDRAWLQLMWAAEPALVLESFLEGPKFDVDVVLERGEPAYAQVIDDLAPCGVRDVRRVAPAAVGPAVEVALIAHAVRCLRAIGFVEGAFNVEVKWTPDGPRTVEVNGRLGGYSTVDVHREVWGVDLVGLWLRSCFGVPLDVRRASPTVYVAESLLPAGCSGRVRDDRFLTAIDGDPALVARRPWVDTGDLVAGIETGAPDWLGSVVVRGTSREDAIAHLDRLVARVPSPVEALPGAPGALPIDSEV